MFVFDRQQGTWRCDLAQIQAMPATPDVIDLMLARLAALPPRTLAALKVAACLGTQFALEVLAGVLGESEQVTAEDLWPAIEARLILALTHDLRLPQIPQDSVPLAHVAAGITTRYLAPNQPSPPLMAPEGEIGGAGLPRMRLSHGPEQRLYRFTEFGARGAGIADFRSRISRPSIGRSAAGSWSPCLRAKERGKLRRCWTI